MYANSKFQRLSKHIIQELLLSILERYTPGKQFSLRSGHLYFYTIQSLRTVYFSVLSNNLSNWCHEQFFFHANIIQKEFNLLQMEQVDSWLHPSLVCERFLALRYSLTSPLVASLTSSQIYKHILALKEFSQTTCICLFRKKAFQFELLFYCLLFWPAAMQASRLQKSYFFHRNDMLGFPVFTSSEYWASFSFSRAQSYVLVVVLFSNLLCFILMTYSNIIILKTSRKKIN